VDGVIGRRQEADGREFGIGFALGLPGQEAWNGDFMMQGAGGGNGFVTDHDSLTKRLRIDGGEFKIRSPIPHSQPLGRTKSVARRPPPVCGVSAYAFPRYWTA
jgi:hypothetical protein